MANINFVLILFFIIGALARLGALARCAKEDLEERSKEKTDRIFKLLGEEAD
jgi:hypothetical protein